MTQLGNVGVIITSDESLVLLARAGDKSAFAELWQRHARSGVRVARQFTSTSDADDLVSEAYVRIYQRVLAGGGPEGAFRPYLYTTIRNLAARWGQSDHSVNVDDIGEFEAIVDGDDPAMVALDRTLTARAFRSLPDRWQTVLWYTEVEGMDPHEVAPLLGISANGVAALAYRAREGLRKAWLQAHVSDATATGDCRWTIERLGDHARNGLTVRDRDRVDEHLATCAKCSIISEEVDEVGSRLALVMLPLILGGTVGGLFLASLSAPTGAMATELVSATMPPAFHTFASVGAVTAAPAVATGLTATAVTAPLVGALTLAIAVSGGLAATSVIAAPPAAFAAPFAASPPGSSPESQLPSAEYLPSTVTPDTIPWLIKSSSNPVMPNAGIGVLLPGLDPLKSLVDGTGPVTAGALGGGNTSLQGIVGAVTAPVQNSLSASAAPAAPTGQPTAPVQLDLRGTGTPGATVTLTGRGAVYVTTTVTRSGTWSLHSSALPASTPLQLKQTLVSLLGVNLISAPLIVVSKNLAVVVNILGS